MFPLDPNLHGCEDGSRHIDPRLGAPHPSFLGDANELGKVQHASSGKNYYEDWSQSGKAKLGIREKDGDCSLDWRGPKLVQGCGALADTLRVCENERHRHGLVKSRTAEVQRPGVDEAAETAANRSDKSICHLVIRALRNCLAKEDQKPCARQSPSDLIRLPRIGRRRPDDEKGYRVLESCQCKPGCHASQKDRLGGP